MVYLVVLDESQAALMVTRYLGEQGALSEQHEGQHAVERTQRHREMQAAQPVAGAVRSPRKPRQQEG